MLHRVTTLLLACGLLLLSAGAQAGRREEATLLKATQVVTEAAGMPDQTMPDWLLKRAYGIAIIPNVVKVGLGIGGRGGKGVLMVRDNQDHWSNPSFLTLGGGSIGWQFGIQSSDIVLVFTTRRSIEGITGGKVTLGADAGIAVGPVGRQVSGATDIGGAEIYSYSRSQGFFGGLAIDGSIIATDNSANASFYGRAGILGSEVLANTQSPPTAAEPLLAAIRKLVGSRDSEPAPKASPAASPTPTAPSPAPDAKGLESTEATTHPLTEPK